MHLNPLYIMTCTERRLPSWLGWWGSQSCKPSRCFGTMHGALGDRDEVKEESGLHSNQIYLSRHGTNLEACCRLRPWAPMLYKKMTKEQRKKLTSKGVSIVYFNKAGKKVVSGT